MGNDKITQFSLRPCELKPIVDLVGNYFRWFVKDMKNKIPGEKMNMCLDDDLKKTIWIDG